MNQKNQGILFIIMAGFFFASMTFFIRLSGDLPTMEKVFFRNIIATVLTFVLLLRSQEKFHVKKDSLPYLFLRCACGTVGLLCNFYTIDKMQIADANILNKLSPFFAIIFSAILMKEKANKKEWLAVVAAFAGAIFIVKPSFQMQFVYALVGVLGGLGAGAAYTFVRKLGQLGERKLIIVFAFSVFSTLFSLPFMLLQFQPLEPLQLACLILAGLCATGGQISITTAYSKAPAKEISVFDYTQVVFAALLGFFFLDQIPDLYSIIGYVIIIGSAVFKWAYVNRKTESAYQSI